MAEPRITRLLVVEDEINVGATLVERLKKETFDVTWAKTAEEALFEVRGRHFDLALMDVGLPDGSGFDVAAELRKLHPTTAIIFITAFGSAEDKIRGLELGAEDYVVKPFHLRELLLRVQNGLKRARYLTAGLLEPSAHEAVVVGQASIDFTRFEAHSKGVKTSLTHKEVALLKFLVDRQGKVVSRDEILNQVWSEDEFPTSRTVDNFIMRLRRLVEVDPENPQLIRNIRGVGYQLNLAPINSGSGEVKK
ncbi:response regulator transcription factor [Bdellovibrionota bacterium FG-1]